MTLNILFFTITIKKRNLSVEEALQNQMIKKIQEENRDRQFSLYRHF